MKAVKRLSIRESTGPRDTIALEVKRSFRFIIIILLGRNHTTCSNFVML